MDLKHKFEPNKGLNLFLTYTNCNLKYESRFKLVFKMQFFLIPRQITWVNSFDLHLTNTSCGEMAQYFVSSLITYL